MVCLLDFTMSILQRWKQSNRIMRRVQRHGALSTIFRRPSVEGEIGLQFTQPVMGAPLPSVQFAPELPDLIDEVDELAPIPTHEGMALSATTVSSNPIVRTPPQDTKQAAFSLALQKDSLSDRAATSTAIVDRNEGTVAGETDDVTQRPVQRIQETGSSSATVGQQLPTSVQAMPVSSNFAVGSRSVATLPKSASAPVTPQPITAQTYTSQSQTLQGKPNQPRPLQRVQNLGGTQPTTTQPPTALRQSQSQTTQLQDSNDASVSISQPRANSPVSRVQTSQPADSLPIPSPVVSPSSESGIDDQTWNKLQVIYRRHKEMEAAEASAIQEEPAKPSLSTNEKSGLPLQRQSATRAAQPIYMTERREQGEIVQTIESVGLPNRRRVEQSGVPPEYEASRTLSPSTSIQREFGAESPVASDKTGQQEQSSTTAQKTDRVPVDLQDTQSQPISMISATNSEEGVIESIPTSVTGKQASSKTTSDTSEAFIQAASDWKEVVNPALHNATNDGNQAIETPDPKIGEAANFTEKQPLSLQEQWPIQRTAEPADGFEPIEEIEISANSEDQYFNPHPLLHANQVDELRKQVGDTGSSRPTEAAVDLILPRRARPVRSASSIQRSEQKPVTATQTKVQSANLANSATQNSGSSMVETEIGPLPADLWHLIGQPVPDVQSATRENLAPEQSSVFPNTERTTINSTLDSMGHAKHSTEDHQPKLTSVSSDKTDQHRTRTQDINSIAQRVEVHSEAKVEQTEQSIEQPPVSTDLLVVSSKNAHQTDKGAKSTRHISNPTASTVNQNTQSSAEPAVTARRINRKQSEPQNKPLLTIEVPTIQRQENSTSSIDNNSAQEMSAASGGLEQQVKKNGSDIDELAAQVYRQLKRKLIVERERLRRSG